MNLQRWNSHWQMQINMMRIRMMEEMIILVGMMNLPELLFPEQMPLSIRRVRLPALSWIFRKAISRYHSWKRKRIKKLITAKLDGTVTYVGDSGSGETTDGKALIKIKSSDGFYVVGSVM